MPNLTIAGATPIAAWIPSLDTTGNGTTTLYDLTGNGYDGTLTNMDAATDWVADTSNGGVRALDFDGTDDYAIINSPVVSAFPFTFSLWARPNVASVAGCMVSLIDISEFNRYFDLDLVSSAYRIVARNTTFYEASGGTGLDATWAHVVGVYQSNTVKQLYVNGTLVNTLTTSVAFSGLIDSILIGRLRNVTTTVPWAGRLDDIRLFDVALDGTQIAALYNGGNGRGVVVANSAGFSSPFPVMSIGSLGAWIPFYRPTKRSYRYLKSRHK